MTSSDGQGIPIVWLVKWEPRPRGWGARADAHLNATSCGLCDADPLQAVHIGDKDQLASLHFFQDEQPTRLDLIGKLDLGRLLGSKAEEQASGGSAGTDCLFDELLSCGLVPDTGNVGRARAGIASVGTVL